MWAPEPYKEHIQVQSHIKRRLSSPGKQRSAMHLIACRQLSRDGIQTPYLFSPVPFPFLCVESNEVWWGKRGRTICGMTCQFKWASRLKNSTLSPSQQCPPGETGQYQDCGRGVLWSESSCFFESSGSLHPSKDPVTLTQTQNIARCFAKQLSCLDRVLPGKPATYNTQTGSWHFFGTTQRHLSLPRGSVSFQWAACCQVSLWRSRALLL